MSFPFNRYGPQPLALGTGLPPALLARILARARQRQLLQQLQQRPRLTRAEGMERLQAYRDRQSLRETQAPEDMVKTLEKVSKMADLEMTDITTMEVTVGKTSNSKDRDITTSNSKLQDITTSIKINSQETVLRTSKTIKINSKDQDITTNTRTSSKEIRVIRTVDMISNNKDLDTMIKTKTSNP